MRLICLLTVLVGSLLCGCTHTGNSNTRQGSVSFYAMEFGIVSEFQTNNESLVGMSYVRLEAKDTFRLTAEDSAVLGNFSDAIALKKRDLDMQFNPIRERPDESGMDHKCFVLNSIGDDWAVFLKKDGSILVYEVKYYNTYMLLGDFLFTEKNDSVYRILSQCRDTYYAANPDDCDC